MADYYDPYWKQTDELSDFVYKWPVVSKSIPQQQDITFLDYGCGTGKIAKKILEMNPKSKIVGMDVSGYAIKKISKLFPKQKFYQVADGGKLPIKNKSIDFIVALDVIEHIVDTDFILDEFNRSLPQGGKLLISTPYHGIIKNIIISLIAFELIFNPYSAHLRFFTKKSLFEGLKRHGFKPLNFGYFGRFFPISNGMYVLAEKS